jgi:hypothetical protein
MRRPRRLVGLQRTWYVTNGAGFDDLTDFRSKNIIPGKAGVHLSAYQAADKWIPAFAGMTIMLDRISPEFALANTDCFSPDGLPQGLRN